MVMIQMLEGLTQVEKQEKMLSLKMKRISGIEFNILIEM
jgi:hypothetical protein